MLLLCSGCVDAAKKATPPNIVIIVADDLGYGDLGAYGQEKINTPELDELALEGMRFTDFYAGSTVCAPSRASLLTGLHTGNSPVRGNPRWTATGKPVDLEDSDVLFSEVLQQTGYATAVIGKWGMAEDRSRGHAASNPAMPLQQGFDYFYGYRYHSDAHHYYWPTLYENHSVIELPDNDPETNSGHYTHDLFTEKALSYIKNQDGDQPFVLYLAYTIPHMALTVPDDSETPYKDLGWPVAELSRNHYKHDPNPNTAFAGMISRMDRDVGRIVDQLRQQGIAENTLLLFTSDNGHEFESELFDSNGPLRGRKRDLYEGGIRVPMIAWWPGTITAGADSQHVSAFWDVMATVCEIAQIEECPHGDGISFAPTLYGDHTGQSRHQYLYWEFNESRGPIQALRSGDWKLVRFLGQPPELYDLSRDIGEQLNVAESFPSVVAELTAILDSARSEHPAFVLERHPRLSEN